MNVCLAHCGLRQIAGKCLSAALGYEVSGILHMKMPEYCTAFGRPL